VSRRLVGGTRHHGLLRDRSALGESADLRKRRPKPHTIWHLDAGRMVYLWRAVDAEGEVLDVPVQSRRNKRAALELMRKLLK
jgi:putative transposase